MDITKLGPVVQSFPKATPLEESYKCYQSLRKKKKKIPGGGKTLRKALTGKPRDMGTKGASCNRGVTTEGETGQASTLKGLVEKQVIVDQKKTNRS